MDCYFNPKKQNNKYNRFPHDLYDSLESKHYSIPPAERNEHDGWVTARFSPHRNQENIIYLGDDPGNIGVFNADLICDPHVPIEKKRLHFFSAHYGTIMDIVGVPRKESQIVSISGDSTIRCWDLNQKEDDRKSELFLGHEGSVRAIDFVPDDSNVFVTGSRDGQVKVWDMRVSSCRKKEKEYRPPISSYRCAHPFLLEKNNGTPRSKSKKQITATSVTSVIFVNEHTVASASSSAETGIRLWDIRKSTHNNEASPASILQIPVTKKRQAGFGVTCLSMDRFRSNLFASCTNSIIYEYATTTTDTSPIRAFSGAVIRDYYTQVACSPIGDFFACGSEDNRALIWDLQDQYSYANSWYEPDEALKQRTTLPKWSCGGHESKVLGVGWSVNAKYFMTLDDDGLRIWTGNQKVQPWKCLDNEKSPVKSFNDSSPGLLYEKAARYKLSDQEETMIQIDDMSLTPRRRSNSIQINTPKKRIPKRPLMRSPFKSPSKCSPQAKMSKISSSPPKSILSAVNIPNGEMTPKQKKPKFNPFFSRYPTENLPNFVYDRFVASLIGEKSELEPHQELSKVAERFGIWRIGLLSGDIGRATAIVSEKVDC
ncbi:unnamed protein product [Caenorhabditis bovis]|uniref:WD40 repeat-like protein n=1 Tax=Caenorhabditis bovis TaxID=2654633 RepID=A0A8S1E6L3_9PELO|nr:unnamed protein product [Caenorhabditis bovis]